jgi:hypothetical protein
MPARPGPDSHPVIMEPDDVIRVVRRGPTGRFGWWLGFADGEDVEKR